MVTELPGINFAVAHATKEKEAASNFETPSFIIINTTNYTTTSAGVTLRASHKNSFMK